MTSLKLNYHQNSENANKPSSSKLRISTMTATCNISSNVNLKIVSKYLPINDFIRYIEYANEITRGTKTKHISDKKASKKKLFYNQITIIVNILGSYTNIKLFNNGSISMTGLKSMEGGINAIHSLIEELSNIQGEIDGVILPGLSNPSCVLKDFDIVLINSDFYTGFEIKRSELHHLLVTDYKIFSSYEPCIYPGVNSKFYWNKDYRDLPHKGKCYCTVQCNGKGRGAGNGDCKKITIATFQSGSVIITGARNMQQVEDAYKFINNIFDTHFEYLKKQNAPFLDLEDTFHHKTSLKKSDKNIIYLPKSKITIKYSNV